VFLVIIMGCRNKTTHVHNTRCDLIHSDSVLGNTYYNEWCYQSSGNIYSSYTIRGLQYLNEMIHYYPNGKIRGYAFYNITGKEVFLRIYDEKGIVKEESGNFYCYVTINKCKSMIGDTIVIDFFIASPPNTYYKIFEMNSDGRHEINFADTIVPYQRRLKFIPQKASSYIFPYEIEFYDTIRKTKEIQKDDICFDVIERGGSVP